MIFAATGHRPNKLGGYSPAAMLKLTEFAFQYLTLIDQPDKIVSGMAIGWDQAVAHAAVLCGVPFIAAVPFAGQELTWPTLAQEQYRRLLDRADEVVIVTPGSYSPAKMHARNEWMVDHADKVIALWNGTEGGTASCVAYAEGVRRPVENLWSMWKKWP